MGFEELKERYSKFLSRRDKFRNPISFWDGDLAPPDLIGLEVGLPNENLFPIKAIDLHLVDKPFDDKEAFVASMDRYNNPEGLPIARSFQYSETRGMFPLINFCKKVIGTVNKPAYDEWDVLLSNGSSDSMFKIFETFCDESTTVLMEEFTFSPVISNVQNTGATCVPIQMELTTDPAKQGIDIAYLTHLLDNWNTIPHYSHLNKPKLIYTIATGQNPTGMTLSMEKRRQIYALAQKHDLLILEDDPYGYLRFSPYDPADPLKNLYTDESHSLTVEDYLQKMLVKSFMTLDTDGRVIRLETFSKLFAPGLRLAYIAANKFIIERLLNFTEVTTRAPSGASQAIVYTTIKALGSKETAADEMDAMFLGWIKWVMKLASAYTHRRNVTFKALYETEAYKKNFFTVLEPSAGMFIDIKVNWPTPPTGDKKELMSQLNKIIIKNGVKVVLGHKMAVDQDFSSDSADFLRLTVAYAKDEDQLTEACHRIGKGFVELFNM